MRYRDLWSCLLALGPSVGLLTCGCRMPPASAPPPPGDAPAPRAQLASAGAEPITLFGDLPDRAQPEYHMSSQVALRRHTFTEEGGDFDPDVDPAGKLLVYASTRHNTAADLYIQAIDGVAVTQLTSDPASDVEPAFSPDGQRVAFASDRAGDWDIWIINVDGTQPVQVTSGPGDDIHPSWSPDGQSLVYCSLPPGSGQWELWVTAAAAGGVRHYLGQGLFPEWSPAGSTLLYQRARQRGSRWFSIWTLTLVEGEPRYPTEVAASSRYAMITPTWSPDGAHIAFTTLPTAPLEQPQGSVLDAPSDVWIVQLDGRGRRMMTDGHQANQSPVFGQDGRLYFVSSRAGQPNVWSLPLSESPVADSARLTTFQEAPGGPREVIEASHRPGAAAASGAREE